MRYIHDMPLSPGETDALRTFTDRVRALAGVDVVRIALFGSRARGEGDEDSDLDIVVVVRACAHADADADGGADAGVRKRRRAIQDIAADIDDATGLRLMPVVLDEEAFARSFPLHGAVERDGIPL